MISYMNNMNNVMIMRQHCRFRLQLFNLQIDEWSQENASMNHTIASLLFHFLSKCGFFGGNGKTFYLYSYLSGKIRLTDAMR